MGNNTGINGALESVSPDELNQHFRYILVSDDDICYRVALDLPIEILASHDDLANQNSPTDSGEKASFSL